MAESVHTHHMTTTQHTISTRIPTRIKCQCGHVHSVAMPQCPACNRKARKVTR